MKIPTLSLIFSSLLLFTNKVYSTDITSLISWNIGLEEKYANERVEGIIQAVNNTYADVACLSEIWGGPYRIKQFADTLKVKYPYSYSLVDEKYMKGEMTGPYFPACSSVETKQVEPAIPKIMDCLLGDDFESCSLQVMREELNLSHRGTCWACLIEMAYKIYSKQPYHLSMCIYPQLWDDEIIQPWSQTLGLLLLSKYELTNIQKEFLPTALVPRGYISGVKNSTMIVCTHLTVPGVPYPYPFITPDPELTSWAKENYIQARILSKVADEYIKQNTSNKVVMTGDFNHGRAIHYYNVSAVNVEAYDLLDVNLTDNYYGPCTCCKENIVYATIPQTIYDTIWTYGFNYRKVKRVYDEQYSISVKGECIKMQLSDHYGLYASMDNTDMKKLDIYCSKAHKVELTGILPIYISIMLVLNHLLF